MQYSIKMITLYLLACIFTRVLVFGQQYGGQALSQKFDQICAVISKKK